MAIQVKFWSILVDFTMTLFSNLVIVVANFEKKKSKFTIFHIKVWAKSPSFKELARNI